MTPRLPVPACPDCDLGPDLFSALDRRGFIRSVGTQAAALATIGTAVPAVAHAAVKPAATSATKPAENLVREMFATLTADQKKAVVLPWDHGVKDGKGTPTRLGMYNAAVNKQTVIKDAYTKSQQELLDRIFRSIAAGDDGYMRLSRGGNFDNSGAFENIGAAIFGEPTDGKPFSLVFAGHHLTVRCDGNSEPGAAFGGPMYNGHSPNGYSNRNVFNYQTKSVQAVFEALDPKQRKAALVKGSPGEQAGSVQFRKKGEAHPGISVGVLSRDQRALVEQVMRTLISPFRAEDADEVMAIVKQNGGPEAIHLAFYEDAKMEDGQPWHFWRLEGPGFVWNFRVLPHVHTFVNIRGKA